MLQPDTLDFYSFSLYYGTPLLSSCGKQGSFQKGKELEEKIEAVGNSSPIKNLLHIKKC